MAGDENQKVPKIKKRRLLGVIFSLVSLLILTYISLTLITGREVVFSRIIGLFSQKAPIPLADSFDFDVGRNRVFADMGSFVAATGTLGIQVLDRGGNETLRDSLRMTNPVIASAGGHAIAFDVGGSSVRTFTESALSASLEAGGAVVSAAINANGWFSVCTQEGVAYRSIVTVYSDSGQSAYRVSLATGYALYAALSPDNSKLAVLIVTDGGSRIRLYDLSSEDPDYELDLAGRLVLDIRFLSGGGILAITMDSLMIVDTEGSENDFFGFDGRRLGGYTFGDNLVALHLLDFSVGHRGRLITLDSSGRLLGGITTDKAILSTSYSDGYLAVLYSDGPVFYDAEMNQYPPDPDHVAVAGATQIASLGGGAFLVASDHFANVYRVSTDSNED